MSDKHVELAQITLPSFGLPTSEPTIPPHTYEARLAEARRRAAAASYDALLVYADREHFANLAYLTGFDPRFEEALLIVVPERSPTLLAGNEDVVYTAISPLTLNVVLYQTFSLLSQPRATSAPLVTILRDAGLGDGAARRVGIAGWKYFGPEETDDADRWSEAPAYLVTPCAAWAATCATPTACLWTLSRACARSMMWTNWPASSSRPPTAPRACATCCSPYGPA